MVERLALVVEDPDAAAPGDRLVAAGSPIAWFSSSSS